MQPIRLTPAHKMLASAVLVGVVIVGGASVTAAAFAGRLDEVAKVGDVPAAKLGPANGTGGRSSDVAPADPRATGFTGPRPSPLADPDVVSKAITDDPDGVSEYWTPERLHDASPLPLPEVRVTVIPD